jgi:hypothetical protein
MEDYTTCFGFAKGVCRDHFIINFKGPPSKIRLRTTRNDRFLLSLKNLIEMYGFMELPPDMSIRNSS